eukprot:TRINITY_DN6128_c0_g1_i2.p1 TRINITY_DN6128_c0_g1~~TRINITY_DN6128_c0_g1_i2.p1  ORF type:complete len:402 (+),score=64.38 TRINITY_DN6128_c0_g1_i2:110-1315(+)
MKKELRLNLGALIHTTDDEYNPFVNPLLEARRSRKYSRGDSFGAIEVQKDAGGLVGNQKFENFNLEAAYFSVATKICNRSQMEDRVIVIPFENSWKGDAAFGVLDGHSGSYVSEYLMEELFPTLQKNPSYCFDLKAALTRTFQDVNKDILNYLAKLKIAGGSTALLAVFRGKQVTIANVGDCRAFVLRRGQLSVLTTDHRLTNELEKTAVTERGGEILMKDRRALLCGSLSVSRAFGDIFYKDYITADPDIFDLTIATDDEYLVLATDGFWEMIDSEEEFIDQLRTKWGRASKILEHYVEKKQSVTKDNASLIVIDLSCLYTKIAANNSGEFNDLSSSFSALSQSKQRGIKPLGLTLPVHHTSEQEDNDVLCDDEIDEAALTAGPKKSVTAQKKPGFSFAF